MKERKFKAFWEDYKIWREFGLGEDYFKECSPIDGELCRLGLEEADVIIEYTTRKDKHGKEIYEGDVLKDKSGSIGYVVWFDYMWALKSPGSEAIDQISNWNSLEVIGNIYDDPLLII